MAAKTLSTGPAALALGESMPPHEKHAVSVSLPKWHHVVDYMSQDKAVHDKLQCDYPRFYQHALVRTLAAHVSERISLPDDMRCLPFPSEEAGLRFEQFLRQRMAGLTSGMASPEGRIRHVSFRLPSSAPSEAQQWSRFYAVLFPRESANDAAEFWACMGDGISSRHADYCIAVFPCMDSDSVDPLLQTTATESFGGVVPPHWSRPEGETKKDLRAAIAAYATSLAPGYASISPEDVYLFAKGMCAIGSIARLLVPDTSAPSEAVVFGWPYGSTPKCVSASGYERFTFHMQGSLQELDQLEASLESGNIITCLFCEIPSNPLCSTPDLHRLRALADRYGFVIICDETVGTFVNVDVLPFVDLLVTSLTKMFSGACNVMGGSIVLNAESHFYSRLRDTLNKSYQDLLFPADAETLLQNCLDLPRRVKRSNSNAVALSRILCSSPSITRVNYPTLVPSAPFYERYRRPGGGYGCLISLVFADSDSAVTFYDALDVCKGPSFGTNFTLVLPYSQVAHAFELEWAEKQGLAKHLLRISVGMEDEKLLLAKFDLALRAVHRLALGSTRAQLC